MNPEFRRETPADSRAVEALTREAFWNLHVPGCDEHYLAHIMRNHPDFVPELSFVAELDGQVVGSILYTRARVENCPVLSFGPIAVRPDCQRQGIGKALMAHTWAPAAALGYRAVLIYGHPMHYTSGGFFPASEVGITTSDGMYLPALLARELVPGGLVGVKGRFFESPVYHFDPAAAAAFDAGLPPKERQSGLPSQLAFAAMAKRAEHPCDLAARAISAALAGETDEVAALSVVASILQFYLPDLNWAGFYLLRGETLVVGPFQGKPPCVRIPVGKGVCGAAVAQRAAIRVEDVHEFAGHIACDAASNSELVIPIFRRGEVYGVLDLDSPTIGRFTETDEAILTRAMEDLGAWLSTL